MTGPIEAPYALARFRADGAVRLGVVSGGRIRALEPHELGTPDLNTFLGAPDWASLERAAATGDGWSALADAVLVAPVEPRQVIQAGANYRTHVVDLIVASTPEDDPRPESEIREAAGRMMDARRAHGEPYCFIGLPACVVGDDEPMTLPAWSDRHDWELELAVVIGREAFRVRRADAMDHVAGYTIVNDVTTRDRIFRDDSKGLGADWYRGKNAPGFLPTGPFLVPQRFVDPADLAIRLEVDGRTMQDATTADMLFDIPALIEAASANMPLLPGDLLLTGSPSGNGAAHGRYLRPGDVMRGTIQGLGTQTVVCVAETREEAHA